MAELAVDSRLNELHQERLKQKKYSRHHLLRGAAAYARRLDGHELPFYASLDADGFEAA